MGSSCLLGFSPRCSNRWRHSLLTWETGPMFDDPVILMTNGKYLAMLCSGVLRVNLTYYHRLAGAISQHALGTGYGGWKVSSQAGIQCRDNNVGQVESGQGRDQTFCHFCILIFTLPSWACRRIDAHKVRMCVRLCYWNIWSLVLPLGARQCMLDAV